MRDVRIAKRYRSPSVIERHLGLYLDRLGSAKNQKKWTDSFRMLGLYGVLCVNRGEGWYEDTTGLKLNLEEGDVFFLFPVLPVIYNPWDTWDTSWITWGGEQAERLEKAGCVTRNNILLKNSGGIFQIAFNELLRISGQTDELNTFKRKTIIENMILELYEKSRLANTFRDKVIEIINEHEFKNPSLSDVSRHMNMSESNFRKIIKKETNMTFFSLLNEYRLSIAKQMLLGCGTVKDIASALGYCDEFYFRASFKKYTKMTPHDYIKKQFIHV